MKSYLFYFSNIFLVKRNNNDKLNNKILVTKYIIISLFVVPYIINTPLNIKPIVKVLINELYKLSDITGIFIFTFINIILIITPNINGIKNAKYI